MEVIYHNTRCYANLIGRALKTRYFSRTLKCVDDQIWCHAVEEMSQGLIDTQLGSRIVKKRIALKGREKRSGARTIVVTKTVRTAKATQRKAQSPIPKAVHETAAGFHRLGFIDKRKMQEYDALCLEPIPDYDGKQIKRIRTKLNLSQPVFAAVPNTTLSTVVQWEGGKSTLVALL